MDDLFSKLMLAYILFAVGFIICVVALFVCGHNAIVDGSALRQYQQDCASTVQVKRNPGDFGVCYNGQATVTVTRTENVITHQHAYLNKGNSNYTFYANLTLPDGSQPACQVSTAFGQSHLLYSGPCQVQVWKKAVTQLTVNNQTEATPDNPPLKFHRDLINTGLSILGAVIFAGLALFFNKRDSALQYS